MIFGPATSFANGVTRFGILSVDIVGFIVAFGAGLWLGNKWFGKSRLVGLPLGIFFSLYVLIALVLAQFW